MLAIVVLRSNQTLCFLMIIWMKKELHKFFFSYKAIKCHIFLKIVIDINVRGDFSQNLGSNYNLGQNI